MAHITGGPNGGDQAPTARDGELHPDLVGLRTLAEAANLVEVGGGVWEFQQRVDGPDGPTTVWVRRYPDGTLGVGYETGKPGRTERTRAMFLPDQTSARILAEQKTPDGAEATLHVEYNGHEVTGGLTEAQSNPYDDPQVAQRLTTDVYTPEGAHMAGSALAEELERNLRLIAEQDPSATAE